jgi:hypothetical protein
MRGMKSPVKLALIICALVLFLCLILVWLLSRRNESDTPVVSATSGSPEFAVQVEKPRMDRPFAGLLPGPLEAFLTSDLRFGHASAGAKVGRVEPNHVELSAERWDLVIETDAEGKITAGTRLVFPLEIADVLVPMRCRPADPAIGYLKATPRPSTSESKTSDLLDGRFIIELARCEKAQTGKILDTEAGGDPGQAWPSSPLTLRGSFAGLPLGHR